MKSNAGKIIADKNIRVSTDTKQKLDQIGTKNQSYDQVVRQLLVEYQVQD